jgi:hypothetical protein
MITPPSIRQRCLRELAACAQRLAVVAGDGKAVAAILDDADAIARFASWLDPEGWARIQANRLDVQRRRALRICAVPVCSNPSRPGADNCESCQATLTGGLR